MNYNTPNESSLLDLIGALKGGLDPNTAYGVYQNIQQDQAQQVAQRQERLGGLAELLSGVAMQGMPYSGASALAEAAPGPAGPAVQSMLQSLYPSSEPVAPPTNASGAVMDMPAGSRPTETGFTPINAAGTAGGYQVPSTQTSPTFQPPQPSPTEQLAMQEAQQQQQTAPLWQEFVQNAQDYAARGAPKEQFLMDAAKAYPELFSADIGQVQQIVLTIFAQPAPGV